MLTLFDFAEVALQDSQPEPEIELRQYTTAEAVKLALLTVGQALKDAQQNSKPEECRQARNWLLTGGIEWLQVVEQNITIDQLRRKFEDPQQCRSCKIQVCCSHAIHALDTERAQAEVPIKLRRDKANMTEDGLTGQQNVFVKAFLQSWDSSKAARKAGYAYPAAAGPSILKKPLVVEAIKKRAKEQKRSAGEMLLKLALPASASIGEFLKFEYVDVLDQATGKPKQQTTMVGIDLKKVKQHGYLVKETIDREEDRHNYELFDVRGVLQQLGKRAKLFLEAYGLDPDDLPALVQVRISADQYDDERER